MIDLHTHILAGIDDGPARIDESIQMVAQAAGVGIKVIVATPHILAPPTSDFCEKILRAANDLQAEIVARKIDIKIIASAEFFVFPELPEFIKKHEEFIIRYKRNYLLLEFPVYQIPIFAEDVIFQLLINKCLPIIAHPERNLEIQQNPDRLQSLIEKGAMAQLNAGSLVGVYGKKVQKTARTLLKKNLIHIMGSDIHSLSRDTYLLTKGLDAAAKIIGRERAEQLVSY